MSADAPVVLLLAGEASGDLHAAPVATALRKRMPGLRILGTGGPRMREAGVELLADLDDLAVMGFAEVIRRIPYFLRLERRLGRVMRDTPVSLLLAVDYPGFNLRMSRMARTMGIPVLYYVAPQLWAWKPKRGARLARDTDVVATILPFEAPILERWGARAVFVGHPLLSEEEGGEGREALGRHGLDPERPVLALFPGSRAQEIERHGTIFLDAGERLRALRPELQLAVATAPGRRPLPGVDPSIFQVPDGRLLLRHARAALVKSGTTTLEAALAHTPFVVAYRTSRMTWELAKRLVRVEHVALANLVAGRRVVPEFLQDDVTPEALVAALLPLIDDGEARDEVLRGLQEIEGALGTPGAAGRVADLAVDLLRSGG